MRDVHLYFSIDRGPCQRSHLSLVFFESLQVFIHKGDTDLAYEISPMYRESPQRGDFCLGTIDIIGNSV